MKTLKDFDFGARTGTSDYPWEEILDGQIRQLEQGKDYECKTATFATLARNAARKVGKTIETKTVEGGIVIRAVAASKDQLAAWEAADAEKAAEKEKEKGKSKGKGK